VTSIAQKAETNLEDLSDKDDNAHDETGLCDIDAGKGFINGPDSHKEIKKDMT